MFALHNIRRLAAAAAIHVSEAIAPVWAPFYMGRIGLEGRCCFVCARLPLDGFGLGLALGGFDE
jgi:hypothetical protein